MEDIKSRINNLKTSDPNLTSKLANNNIIITNNSITKIEQYLDNKVINIYDRPWNKLEYNLKINKLQEFLNNINTDDYENLYKTLSSAIRSNKLKTNNIEYKDCKIMKINYKDLSNASKSISKSVELSLSM